MSTENLLSLRFSTGGSITGMCAGVFTAIRLGGTNDAGGGADEGIGAGRLVNNAGGGADEGIGAGLLVNDGLPVDVERTGGVYSARFRPRAGDGDLADLPNKPIPLPAVAPPLLLGRVLCAPYRKLSDTGGRSMSSSSSSSSPAACEAITRARRALAALAARFCVFRMLDNPEIDDERWCAGDMPGEDEPVLLDPPLCCRAYTGLPALRRSMERAPARVESRNADRAARISPRGLQDDWGGRG